MTHIRTMADAKAANPRFFSEAAMKGFNSRIESELIGGDLFIVSDQFISTDGSVVRPRTYGLHRIDWEDGSVGTVGRYGNLKDAKGVADTLKA
jgi:hypothetical protein